ncbi:MAG: hypothetical protein LH474_00535 [Chamaesiphon sp.]|nr:hypothetical protein [Chamaesiphon sp.]
MSADFPIGQSSLPRSTAEMLAVAEVDRVTSCSFPGTLGLDQEYPRELAAQVLSFLLQV